MQPAQFDREMTLAELLQGVSSAKLSAALDQSLQVHWVLQASDGAALLASTLPGSSTATTFNVALQIELDAIGTLSAQCAPEQVNSAAAWLQLVLTANHRYSMAADLHLETVFINYTDLQAKHLALQESEQRYRELATQLEQRVEEQVVLIARSQRQLYQAEKMASVGSLAAGVAHEINNPIGFINSNLSCAIKNVARMTEVLQAFHQGATSEAEALWQASDLSYVLDDFPSLLQESVTGAERVARIVANLKDYANIDHAKTEMIDLNDAVRTVMDLIGDQPREKIELLMDLQALPPVFCDRGRFNQVLLSLVQNALQALGGTGTGTGTGTIRVSSAVLGEHIRIDVSDNGCGMDAATLARIFDPFFSLQDVGSGTGLGLTVSQEIIASFGGRIEVESTPGTGSTFSVCLPLPQHG